MLQISASNFSFKVENNSTLVHINLTVLCRPCLIWNSDSKNNIFQIRDQAISSPTLNNPKVPIKFDSGALVASFNF